MKILIIIICLTILFACNNQQTEIQNLQKQINALQEKIKDSYKPGFGEYMSNIQTHHAKLWFAGINENWKLADFEINEILETVGSIQKYQTERKETEMIEMILTPIDSVNDAIQHHNKEQFERSYNLLTNTCNSCHRSVNFEFNVVKIPDTLTFSNQEFRIKK